MKKLLALFLMMFCLVGCSEETTTQTQQTTSEETVEMVTIKIYNDENELIEEKTDFSIVEFVASLEMRQECFHAIKHLPLKDEKGKLIGEYEQWYVVWYDEDNKEYSYEIDKSQILTVYYDLGKENIHYNTMWDGHNMYVFIGAFFTPYNPDNIIEGGV